MPKYLSQDPMPVGDVKQNTLNYGLYRLRLQTPIPKSQIRICSRKSAVFNEFPSFLVVSEKFGMQNEIILQFFASFLTLLQLQATKILLWTLINKNKQLNIVNTAEIFYKKCQNFRLKIFILFISLVL
jgi:hypothetical protein